MKTSVISKGASHKESVARIGGSVTRTSNAMTEVTSAVDAVSDVIKAINDIAAETNIIAINTAIKAAHAGKYGEGLSVVVDEVRKLAESTARNSKAISLSLENIMLQIQDAIDEAQYLCQHTEK
jgi:methyl-accepting chemotaxis protein